MTQEELITKQQLEIEAYKKAFKENNRLIERVKGNFIAIGQPLNDNILKFDNKQLTWAMEIYDLLNIEYQEEIK